MTATDDLLVNNAGYADELDAGELPASSSPSRHIAVVTCMDARLDVYRLLGLAPGEAHVIRNAGGVVTEDVIRSLVISQRLLNTREIMILHHTKCGMQSFQDDDVKADIEADTGVRPPFALEAFPDLEGDVRQSMERIRVNPFILHKDAVRGFVYDLDSGRLSEVQ